MITLISSVLAKLRGGKERGLDEDRIEAAYWRFDARRNGYGRWKNAPMSERDAFKVELRSALVADKSHLNGNEE